jgi:hypothetical protein
MGSRGCRCGFITPPSHESRRPGSGPHSRLLAGKSADSLMMGPECGESKGVQLAGRSNEPNLRWPLPKRRCLQCAVAQEVRLWHSLAHVRHSSWRILILLCARWQQQQGAAVCCGAMPCTR